MKRIFLLSIPLLLIPVLFSAPANTQQPAQNVLPNPADYPEAGPNCKRTVRVSPIVDTPGVNWPNTFRCVLTIHTCTGTKTTTSDERSVGTRICADYWNVHGQLATREICCDQGSPQETPSPEERQPPKPKCQPSAPWFDKDTNCPDAQRPVITTSPGHVVLSICGSEIYRHSFDHQPYLEEYAAKLVERVKQQVGSTVCCKSFREALRSGQPCNPGSDVDCDGRPNQTDEIADAPFPDINIFSSPPGASIAPFPAGLDPDDPNFLPGSTARASRDVGDCECKWQLIRGVLNCGTGGQRHSYVATWKCPTTGAEVITTKYATANTPCP